jgi:hypothetical protein
MRFRGICIDGPLKGKEVEGKLNIKIEVDSLTKSAESPNKKQSIPWATIFICFFGVVLFNFFVGDPMGFTNKKTHEAPSSCEKVSSSCY